MDEYEGPSLQTVPVGWFDEAASIAAMARPGGFDVRIELTEGGFIVRGATGDRTAEERLTFFDLSMAADTGNPFRACIGRVVAELRG